MYSKPDFSINPSLPFPIEIAAVMGIVVVVGATVFVYFTRVMN
jgi:hypothetical protein